MFRRDFVEKKVKKMMPFKLVSFLILILAFQTSYCVQDYLGLFCGNYDCYSILGLSQNATIKEVKKAYRTLSLKFHPDKVCIF